ncbi:hypothetical protein CNMCM6106_008975 [Aspergillus hiratsukae]|uniref:Uncharacterized protein n=1 Tax=Aspergillus hiratsukae TaxID=1194566 RepID=A0A8H6PX65_9EURO|nr:hypothetical protein CNMCM6106_008975 [Aspergillus hiratsukae]
MVRVKHRYLLLDILYPEPSSWPTSSTSKPKPLSQADTHAQLRIHSPTSDALTPALLAKMVREEVAEIFGDWGVGRLGGVGAGGDSQVSVACYVDGYHPVSAGVVPARLVGSYVYVAGTGFQ